MSEDLYVRMAWFILGIVLVVIAGTVIWNARLIYYKAVCIWRNRSIHNPYKH